MGVQDGRLVHGCWAVLYVDHCNPFDEQVQKAVRLKSSPRLYIFDFHMPIRLHIRPGLPLR